MSGPAELTTPQAGGSLIAGGDAATAESTVAAAPPLCLNCGTVVAGRYCQSCGQRHDPQVHTVGHFLREATEDLTHADSRVWGTLFALLFKPGYLTREFFAGRRARYLPPVRLYLVVTVLMFLVISLRPGTNDMVVKLDATDAPKKGCAALVYRGPWAAQLQPRLRAGCARAFADNGHELGQVILHNLPRMMFIFLPLIAFFMMLLYWRPRRYYVEHLLFFIHNHAFAFVVATIAGLLALVPIQWPAILGTAVGFYMLWYVYKAMRVFYHQSRRRTLAKLAVMGFVYLVLASFMVLLTGFYSVLTL